MILPDMTYELSGFKIAIASSGLGHVTRGIEAWAADLAQKLHDRGVDVILYKGGGVAARPYEQVLPCWPRDSVTARRLYRFLPRRISWRLGLGSTYGIEQCRFGLGLLRRLRSDSIDILHVQDPQLARLVNGARTLGFLKTKTILAHGTEEPDAFLLRLPYVQHLAPWHQQECAQRGCKRPKWTAIPNFIDTARYYPGDSLELRRELKVPDDAQVVLSVAAVKRGHKRIDHLINEFALLPERRCDRELHLVIAGGRETDTDELVEFAHERLGRRAHLLVGFPRERMPSLYHLADVFTLCSLKEMMPIALLEATASGLPCLTHPHPVMQWMSGPGGEAVDMQSSGALATSLTTLIDDDARRVEMGIAAREHCLKNFGCDAIVAQILEYYKQVLSSDPNSTSSIDCPTSEGARR